MDSQSRRDAMADAETLRRVADDVAQHCYGGYWDGDSCATCDAAVLALRIYSPLDDDAYWADPFTRAADLLADSTRFEARAAFRAVPGLRGDNGGSK